MSVMHRSASLENKESTSLRGDDGDVFFIRDEDCTSEEYELDSESSEEARGGRGVRSSVSLEIYGLQREQQVHFSNLEYYRRLEELKNTHLRNMAELERMYISQGREWRGEEEEGGGPATGRREDRQSFSCPARTLQRINSQEELDFHDTSSGSDQSEDSIGGVDTQRRMSPGQERTFRRDVLLIPQEMMNQKHFRFQPKASCPQPRGRLTHRSGVRARSNSKVTVPKPFQMMLREEDRKRHKVRTRSEVDLENTLLRRELEELRECQKQFRASPAPAHIHLPRFEMTGRRLTQRSIPRSSSSDDVHRDSKINQASAAVSPQPFNFLERERRKREAKIVAELGNVGQREERQGFKARPMPTSVYGTRHRTRSRTSTSQPPSPRSLEATEAQRDPNSHLEQEVLRSKSDSCTDSSEPQRCPTSRPAKKQIQVSIEMVREGGE
ncbi:protein FAM161A isoform X2 [Hippoglossus stenolepis]|uniref:protein FAM161A isoform X2 n=1 Tax=Hippoglossus stenolepis TaxID=195615 RepID=UPI001FAF7894|nr:protein FAM161A isoform X2 [Hippoglossus stenolepis]